MMLFLIVSLWWVVCGCIAAALHYMYAQIAYPEYADANRYDNVVIALQAIPGGPLALAIEVAQWLIDNPKKVHEELLKWRAQQ